MTTASATTQIAGLPGWYIERTDQHAYIEFAVYQTGGAKWGDGTPRDEVKVELWLAEERYGVMGDPQVSWPSTSDKRPDLALALAAALTMAANEAKAQG